jgi:hypothetical protein
LRRARASVGWTASGVTIELAKWTAFALGVVVVVGTFGSLVRSLIVPRGVSSKLSVLIGRGIVRKTFLFVAKRFKSYETKDRILALSGPMSLLALLLSWLVAFLLGYALILWPLINSTFLQALEQSGSSLLTLGFAGSSGPAPNLVYFAAAATGLTVVALLIAYLPTMYAAFNRRETLVTMLQSRAGAPAWGPEILTRHQLVGLTDALPAFYADWERWAADVAESHTTYPVLIWFRSPHALRSWVVALLAVLDSAALYLSLSPNLAPSEARLCLRMGFTCLRNVGDVVGIPYDPDPFPDDPLRLTYEDFVAGVARMAEASFAMERTPEQAWADFKGWRVNYEALCFALADATVAVPAPWSGDRRHLAGITILPKRPADRRPDDPEARAEPKAARFGWRA